MAEATTRTSTRARRAPVRYIDDSTSRSASSNVAPKKSASNKKSEKKKSEKKMSFATPEKRVRKTRRAPAAEESDVSEAEGSSAEDQKENEEPNSQVEVKAKVKSVKKGATKKKNIKSDQEEISKEEVVDDLHFDTNEELFDYYKGFKIVPSLEFSMKMPGHRAKSFAVWEDETVDSKEDAASIKEDEVKMESFESGRMIIGDTAIILGELKCQDRGVPQETDDYGQWTRTGHFRLIFINMNTPWKYVIIYGKEKFDVVENLPEFDSKARLELYLGDESKDISKTESWLIESDGDGECPLLYEDELGGHDFSRSKAFQLASKHLEVPSLLQLLIQAHSSLMSGKLERNQKRVPDFFRYYINRRGERVYFR